LNFQTLYPEISIPDELLLESTYLDWKENHHFQVKQESGTHDPIKSQMLAVVPDNASSKDLLVCSAGGELGNELCE